MAMGEISVRWNFASLIIVAVLFGLSVGIYDLLFPYYLDDLGISFTNMGILFSASALIIALASVYIASASDVRGRKNYYSLGILLGSLSSFIAPLFTALPPLVISKTFREAAVNFRASLHGVLIYEFARGKFADFWAKSRGIEYLSEGSGQLLAGFLLVSIGFTHSFFMAGSLFALSLLVFTLGFREAKSPGGGGRPPGLRESFSLDLPGPLILLAASAFIFAVGLSVSHTFILPLFFAKKFGATVGQVALILGLHRMSFLPLLISGRVVKYSLRRVYIFTMIFEGVVISASGLIPGLLFSAAIWLTHDVLGASLWLPAQATLIQHYARDEYRGRDVSRVRAIGALGWIIGPLLAGWAAPVSISLPFVISGAIVASSVIPIFFLRDPDIEAEITVGGPD